MLDVALASCAVLPEPDPDQPLLEAALARRGLRAATLAWDDPRVRWEDARLVVMRSTWNYPHRPQDFLDWVDRTARQTQLRNAPAVVHANIHKSYLLDLERRGIPAAPTRLVRRGSPASLREVAGDWATVVVKPAISAASLDTFRVDSRAAEGEEHLRRLVETRDALVQPYLRSVEGVGERALVCVDGQLTHAVRKHPRFAAEDESVSPALPIDDDERRLAEAALATVPEPLLYARVDVARGDDGRPLVMELELIEPSLFLMQHPPALERFAGAIARSVRGLSRLS
jgi:glutathione synthase/RimK-type ligase-like ATP-grasp enzyme